MKVLKLVGRIVLVLLMIPTVLQLVVTGIALIPSVHRKPVAISYEPGRFVGILLILILFVWAFRKLGNKGREN